MSLKVSQKIQNHPRLKDTRRGKEKLPAQPFLEGIVAPKPTVNDSGSIFDLRSNPTIALARQGSQYLGLKLISPQIFMILKLVFRIELFEGKLCYLSRKWILRRISGCLELTILIGLTEEKKCRRSQDTTSLRVFTTIVMFLRIDLAIDQRNPQKEARLKLNLKCKLHWMCFCRLLCGHLRGEIRSSTLLQSIESHYRKWVS